MMGDALPVATSWAQ